MEANMELRAGIPYGKQRKYRSSLREERAADTRARIVRAARALFTDRGFTGTTVSGIAERAGVAAPTVYAAFGSKAAIMRALLTQSEDDADASTWRARIDAEPDPNRKLENFAEWSRHLFSGSRDLIAAALAAAGEPAVAELHEQGDQNRRNWLSDIVASLADIGALRPELDQQEAIDLAWMVSGPDLYLRATQTCAWSDDAYQRWLTRHLQHQLLDAGTDKRATTAEPPA